MRNRDRRILEGLAKFRYMDRDILVRLYFRELKQPVTGCNTVMKRLRRDGYVVGREWIGARGGRSLVYALSEKGFGSGGGGIEHCLEVARFYCDVVEAGGELEWFETERRLRSGAVVDVWMKWRKTVFYVEIQRSVVSEREMKRKVERIRSGMEDGGRIWIVSDKRYNLERVVQSRGVQDLLARV